MTIIVADAGPLIGFARIGKLDIIRHLFNFVFIPQKVFDEITVAGEKPGAKAVSKAVTSGWIKIVKVQNNKLTDKLSVLVDKGEAEAIQLSLERNADLLLIDDKKGRKVARKFGIKIIGTGGVLLKAKKIGLINQVSFAISDLANAGYRISTALCNKILELAEEI